MIEDDVSEPRYTLKQASVLVRRKMCKNRGGHLIGRLVYQENHLGDVVAERYGCENCDVRVTLEYPPLDR